jgi:tRNA pseudouridine55 synthase
MYSALKHEGEPLYKLARRGEEVERKPRCVTIHELVQVGGRGDRPELRIRCTKGTYIRTLAQDIGAALGCGAHLGALRRTGSGRFRIEDAVTLEALEAMTPTLRRRRLLPLSELLVGLPRAELDEAAALRLRNGQVVPISGVAQGMCGVFGPGDVVLGLGRCDGASLHALRLTQAPEKHR